MGTIVLLLMQSMTGIYAMVIIPFLILFVLFAFVFLLTHAKSIILTLIGIIILGVLLAVYGIK